MSKMNNKMDDKTDDSAFAQTKGNIIFKTESITSAGPSSYNECRGSRDCEKFFGGNGEQAHDRMHKTPITQLGDLGACIIYHMIWVTG